MTQINSVDSERAVSDVGGISQSSKQKSPAVNKSIDFHHNFRKSRGDIESAKPVHDGKLKF